MFELEIWLIYIIVAIVAVCAEYFMNNFFCINFAFAGIVTALISIFWGDIYITIAIFIVLSIMSIMFIKPLLLKYIKNKNNFDFNEQYIGKIVKTTEPVTHNSGTVTIYEEKWEARITEGENIEAGCDVKITGNKGLILFVEKV